MQKQPNYDEAAGIHYGVIAANALRPEALERMLDKGNDLVYVEAKANFLANLNKWAVKVNHNFEAATREQDSLVAILTQEHVLRHLDDVIYLLCAGADDKNQRVEMVWDLIGDDWNEEYQGDGREQRIVYEGEGYELDLRGQYLFVIKSPYSTFCRLCSPCMPNAGDLGSPDAKDGIKTYCLGHDWFDRKAPYIVGDLETAHIVQPDKHGSGEEAMTAIDIPCMDGCDMSDLLDFVQRAGRDVFVDHPQHGEEQTKQLVKYALAKIAAMHFRELGDIKEAVQYEVECDTIYSNLLPFAKIW